MYNVRGCLTKCILSHPKAQSICYQVKLILRLQKSDKNSMINEALEYNKRQVHCIIDIFSSDLFVLKSGVYNSLEDGGWWVERYFEFGKGLEIKLGIVKKVK